MTTIAFIGLGIMGSPMSVNLTKAGFDVVGYNRSPEKAQPLVDAGGTSASSIAEAVQGADTVAIRGPEPLDVAEVPQAEAGVSASAKSGALIIDFATIRPDVARELAQEAQEKGFRILDAPVSGGEPGAINGALSIMVGGA